MPRCLAFSSRSAVVWSVVLVLISISLLRCVVPTSVGPDAMPIQSRICTAAGPKSVVAMALDRASTGGDRSEGERDDPLWPVLSRRQGDGGPRRAVDPARRARAPRRKHALQRAAPGQPTDVAGPALQE